MASNVFSVRNVPAQLQAALRLLADQEGVTLATLAEEAFAELLAKRGVTDVATQLQGHDIRLRPGRRPKTPWDNEQIVIIDDEDAA